VINKNNILNLAINLYLIVLSLFIIFGRSFSGITIFGIRVGEVMVGLSLIISFAIFLLKILKINLVNKDLKLISSILSLTIFSFLCSIFYTKGSFLLSYTYRSSSIIWTISFIFLSYEIFKRIETEHIFFKVVPYFPVILYILSTIHFPEILISFFTTYSDKFDFVKGSDLLLTFVVCQLFVRNKYENTIKGFAYFILLSAVYIPLFIYKSKGAFIPGVIFIIVNFIYYSKILKTEKLKSAAIIVICVPLFFLSTFNSYGNLSFKKMGMDQYSQEESLISAGSNALKIVLDEKNTPDIFASFFILDGRIYSQEQMANWRLQIWQDIIRDLFWNANYFQSEENYSLVREQGSIRNDLTFIFGFGYNEILPAMNHWERTGTDGTNENPHNFLIYSLGRGGLVLGMLILALHFSLVLIWKNKHKSLTILLYMIPILFTASFDASMESVRFPLIYYSFYSLFLLNNINKSKN